MSSCFLRTCDHASDRKKQKKTTKKIHLSLGSGHTKASTCWTEKAYLMLVRIYNFIAAIVFLWEELFYVIVDLFTVAVPLWVHYMLMIVSILLCSTVHWEFFNNVNYTEGETINGLL